MVGPASGEKTPIPTPAPSPPLPDPRPHPDEPSPDESPAKKAKVASDDALDLDLIDLEKPVQDPATPYSDVDGSQVPTADEDDAQIVFSNPVAIKGIDYRAKMIRAIAADSSGAHGACDRSGAPLVERVEQPSWADEVAGKAGAWFVSEGLKGVRVMWNQQCFVTEAGKRVDVPAEISKKIPKDHAFDGVLVSTDPRVDLKQTVEFDAKIRWAHVSFKIFDHPSLGGRPFSERLADLQLVFASATSDAQDTLSNTSALQPAKTDTPEPTTDTDAENSQPDGSQPLTPSRRGRSQSVSHGSLAAKVPDGFAHVVEHSRCSDLAAVRAFVEKAASGWVYVRHAASLYEPDDVEEWEYVKTKSGGAEEA